MLETSVWLPITNRPNAEVFTPINALANAIKLLPHIFIQEKLMDVPGDLLRNKEKSDLHFGRLQIFAGASKLEATMTP